MIEKRAFTLVEILMVLVVIGSVATIINSMLSRFRKPGDDIFSVLTEVNDLVGFTQQQAVSNQKKYRISFQSNIGKQDLIKIEQEKDDPEKLGKKIYEAVFSDYVDTQYLLPDSIELKSAFKTSRENLFEENKKREAYCFIIPNGLVEPIMIHLVKKGDGVEERFTFNMQPFKGEFDLQQGFARPSKSGVY